METVSERADRQQSPAWRQPTGWAQILLTVAVVVGALDGVNVLRDGYFHVLRPSPTGGTELYIADGIQAVARGDPLYPEVGKPPFVIRVYNPLSYLPGGLLARGFADDFDDVLIVGRIVPYLSTFALLALVVFYVQRRFAMPLVAAFAPVLLLVLHSSTLTDFFRNRPEMPGLLLTFAGWFAYDLKLRRWPVLAALCFTAAFAFKQSFVAAPTAIFLLLAQQRAVRPLLIFSGTLGAGFAAVMALAHFTLGSGYLDHTVRLLASNPVDPWAASVSFYPLLVRHHWGLVFPGAVLAFSWLLLRRDEMPLLVYLAVCLAWTSYSHGKIGADLNYHGELSILMVLVLVVATGRMLQLRSRWSPVPVAAVVAFLVWGIASEGVGWNRVCLNRILPTPHCEPGPSAAGELRLAAEALRERGDDVLVLHPELALRAERVVGLDTTMLTLLFRQGLLDEELLLQPVREQRYQTIVLPRPLVGYLQRVAAVAIDSGYRLTRRDQRWLELSR